MKFSIHSQYFTFFLYLLFFSGVILKGQTFSEPFDLKQWEALSEEQKESTVSDWLEKSNDRNRWSHNARVEFATSAYQYAIILKNQELKMASMLSMVELFFNEARFDDVLPFLDTLSLWAIEKNNIEVRIRVDIYRASIFRYRGKLYNALSITYEAYQLAHNKKLPGMIALTSNNLGVIYRNLGESNLVFSFYSEALESSESAGDTTQLIIAHTGMANYWYFEKDLDKAYELYQLALKLALETNDLQNIAFLHNNLGNVYREKGDFSKAIFHYNKALEMLNEINVVGLRAVILRNMGLVNQRENNLNQALQLFNKSLEITQNIGIESFVRDNYLSISQVYASLGNTKEAYNYLLLYSELSQKLHSSQLANRISYYNEKIYTAQQQEEHYKFRLERNFFILIIVILLLLFLITFSILLFRRFKDKRKHLDRLKSIIEDKVITEKALRQSEENYQTLLKTLNEGIIVLSRDNQIEFINQKAGKILGTNDKDALIGEQFGDFLLAIDDEKLFQEKSELQKMGISDQFEIKLKNLLGDVIWVNMSSAPILDENLKTKGTVALISDVTEKKKSEQTFGELTGNLNQKIKQLNCLYDITDISGVPGISFEDIIEKSLEIIPVGLRYSHDIGVQIMFDNMTYQSQNFVDTDWSYSVPIKVQKKKLGYIKVAYVEEKPNINKDPFHFNEKILLKNISEKFGQIVESKNLEKILLTNQQKLEEIQRIARIGNWEKDLVTQNCEFSETFYEIIGVNHERRRFFDHHKFIETIHPDDKENVLEFEARLLKSDARTDSTTNYRVITGEGAIRYIFSSGRLIKDENNHSVGCVFTVQDITDQKYAQELQHNAELALKTSEAKQQVLANMSYEMRTPITGIMGMTDFLLGSGLTLSQLELAKTIKDSSLGLLNIINNILDLQRIEAGKFRLNNSVFSLSQMLDKVSAIFTALTRNREISLAINIAPNLPDNIFSDQDRLYQVISSLLAIVVENAGKGNITMFLRQESIIDGKMLVMVEIVDDFSTVDFESVRKILQPSERMDEIISSKKENAVVGLAISKKLVEMLDGTIGIARNSPKGTTFFFTFYTTIASETSISEENLKSPDNRKANLEGVKVLCVEDQKINQKVISLMLSHAGCQLSLVSNGKEALDLLSKEKFDVILLDMVMPVMDGVETMQNLKLSHKKYPPVIALSANVLDEDREKYLAAGVIDFVSKPINAAELFEKIEMWHNQTSKKRKPKKVV